MMASKALLTTEVISQAESYDGIRAGIVCLKNLLKGNFSITMGNVTVFQEKAGHRSLNLLLLVHDRQASHKTPVHTRYP